MDKLLAASVLLVPLLLARRAAGFRSPGKGARIVAASSVAYAAAWILALYFLYFRLG